MVIAVHEAVAAGTWENTVTVQLLLPVDVLVVDGLEDVLLLEEVLVLVDETLGLLVDEVLVIVLDAVFVANPPLRQLHALEISAGTAEKAEAKAGSVGVGFFV